MKRGLTAWVVLAIATILLLTTLAIKNSLTAVTSIPAPAVNLVIDSPDGTDCSPYFEASAWRNDKPEVKGSSRCKPDYKVSLESDVDFEVTVVITPGTLPVVVQINDNGPITISDTDGHFIIGPGDSLSATVLSK